MKASVNGSAVLLVLIIMAILLASAGLAVKSTHFMQSLSSDFHKYQNCANITQGLLAYAIDQTRAHYEEFLAYSHPIECIADIDGQQGRITITQQENGFFLEAQLYRGSSSICAMSWSLAKNDENKFEVQCFQK